MSSFKPLARQLLAVLAVLVTLAIGTATAQATHGPGVPYVVGDVFASVGNNSPSSGSEVKQFAPDGTLKHTMNNQLRSSAGGICFDAAANLYLTSLTDESPVITKFDNEGNLVAPSFASGLSDTGACVGDAGGDIFVNQFPGGVARIDASGRRLFTYPASGPVGDIDLAADQCTLYYTSSSSAPSIRRYDVCANRQLPDLTDSLGEDIPFCYALQVRRNGEVLVACDYKVLRLSPGGAILTEYPIENYGGGAEDFLAVSLDPDGRTFWTGDHDHGDIFHIDIATGALVSRFFGQPNSFLKGLAVFGGATALQRLKPGKGCGDKNHVHERFSECKKR